MDQQKIYEEIEDYLNGQLGTEATAKFEQRLRSDAALAARVQLFKNMGTALEDKKAMERQQQIEAIGEGFFAAQKTETPVRRLPFYRKPLSMAASILLLVVAGILWRQFGSNSFSSSDELFAEHFETYPLSEMVRGGNDPENPYQQAVEEYGSKNYPGAVASFRSLLANNPGDVPAAFGLANAYLNGQPAQLDLALRYFQQVAEDGNTAYAPKAEWYIALIYLKKGERDKAKSVLGEIKGEDKNADGLLKKME